MQSDTTVTVKDISKAIDKTPRWVNLRAKKEGWKAKVLNGRGDRRFSLEGLPEDVKMAISAHNFKLMAQNNGPQGSLIYKEARTVPVGSPELADWQNKTALAWADLIRAYLKEKELAASRGKPKVEAAKLYIKGYNTGQLMPKVFEILGNTSWQSVERQLKKFRDANYDYTVLAPRWGKHRGQRKVTDDEFNTMLSFALHPNRLRIAEVIRLTTIALKRRDINSPSSDGTLRRALEDWRKTNEDKWIFCREGEKALNDKCLPYLERDASLLEVGEVLVADGHTLNFQILHPFTGKPCRMTMLMWYDWASCMPVGWEIMPTENVQCVASGMRSAILTLGKMPKVAYLDNGKAFKAKIFTSQDIDFEEAGFYGMFARLGIETIFAWPYNAQSKPVERFFGTFNELERLMPTYTGASIQDKPAHLLRNEKLHRKIHEKKYGGWVPNIDEANRIIAGWLTEYASRPHQGLKGLCPGEVFETGRGPGVDETALRYLMMSMEIKRVHQNGIRFMGRNYYDEALYGYRDRVMIRYDFEDLSKICIYDITGAKQICEAKAVKPVHPVAKLTGRKEDLALVKAGIHQKRTLKKATEKIAREYVEEAPDLIAVPERLKSPPTPLYERGEKGAGFGRLTPGEAERIEAEAAKMKVLELKPKEPELVHMSDPDRYEALLERECRGDELCLDDMQFMRYFEKTGLFKTLKERFEFLRELWIAGDEEDGRV